MNTPCFSDREMMNDVLSSQKFITSGYNTTANEAGEPAVKNVIMTILDEEHKIQHEVFSEMQNRGWYQTEAAPQNKVQETKDKFSENCPSCSF